METIIIDTIALIVIGYFLYDRIRRIMFLRDDKNFMPGAKWPKWLEEDAERWNKNNPKKSVSIKK